MLTQRDKNILPGGRDHETAMRLLNEQGAVLQWMIPGGSGNWNNYEGDDALDPFASDLKWRIKPKLLRYRVGKFSSNAGGVRLCFIEDESTEAYWSRHPRFIGWIGDWQEVDV